MDSFGHFYLGLSSPAPEIHRCVLAFISHMYSIESFEERIHRIYIYVSNLRRNIGMMKADTQELLTLKDALIWGIKVLNAEITTLRRAIDIRSRVSIGNFGMTFSNSRQFIGMVGIDFSLSNQRVIAQDPFMGQTKPFIIDHVTQAQGVTARNSSHYVTQPKQQHIQKPRRRVWTEDFKAKFHNAVEMLGGSKMATGKQIWMMMKDEDDNLTVGHVRSYLQSYRNKERDTEEMLKLRLGRP